MSSRIAQQRLLAMWAAVAVAGVVVGIVVSWWVGLVVFLVGDALVLVRFLAGARTRRARRQAQAEELPDLPPPPGRAIWKFTSWHGRARTYAPYQPGGSEDSAPQE